MNDNKLEKTLDHVISDYLSSDAIELLQKNPISCNAVISMDKIDNLDGHDFEDLISALISKMGFIGEQKRKTADGGIDIVAHSHKPIISGRYIIQCKRKASPVSEPIVRDLYGVITAERANKGIIITNSKFTSAARAFAEGKPIELIDRDGLILLLSQYFDFDYKSETLSLQFRLSEDGRVVVSPNIRQLLVELIKVGRSHERKYEIGDDNQATVIGSRESYINFLNAKFGDLQKLIDDFQKWLNSVDGTLIEDGTDKQESIESLVKNFRILLDYCFVCWKDVYETQPPEGMKSVHDKLLSLFNLFINGILIWLNTSELFLQNPNLFVYDDNRAVVPIDLNTQEFNKILSEIATALGLKSDA